MTGPKSRYRDGARVIAPIALAAAAFGASFGILARTADFSWVAATVMSATTFAGSAQFAVVSTLDTGGAVAPAIVAAVLLNARYAPISVSVAPYFDGSRGKRLLESQLIVDESWVVSRRHDGTFDRRVLVGAGLVLYVVWTSSTAGASSAITFVIRSGRARPPRTTGPIALSPIVAAPESATVSHTFTGRARSGRRRPRR